MRNSTFCIALLLLTAAPPVARAADGDWGPARGLVPYEVSITNATRDQRFTPVLFVVHDARIQLFQVGEAASPELTALAEEGDTAPLTGALSGAAGVRGTMTGDGLLEPGKTLTRRFYARPLERLSAAAMLIPTNDGFFAIHSEPLPIGFAPVRLGIPVYDAGSERNDELCSSIPGPDFEECGGPGGGAEVEGGEEGFVHIHSGIHGIGDLDPARRDWRNPAAVVSIRRLLR